MPYIPKIFMFNENFKKKTLDPVSARWANLPPASNEKKKKKYLFLNMLHRFF